MDTRITFRPAAEDDSSHLAVLVDAASRRLTSYLWNTSAEPGQSAFEVGREFIRTRDDHFNHFSNWQIAELGGRVAGGLNCYRLPASSIVADGPEVTRDLNELKSLVGGAWYIAAASVFPEFRGRGVGQSMLAIAEAQARARGITALVLMVGSRNTGAQRLYERMGFAEAARRSLTPFTGSDPDGYWVLMRRQL